jgi:leucyl-tRNA synthetase
MSKSRGNVVNPDDVIDAHGADAFRLYEMFLGPLEAVKPWSTRSIEGIDRFLQRLWRLGQMVHRPGPAAAASSQASSLGALRRKQHETIKRVTQDLEHLRFNTAISAMMEFQNAIYEVMNSQEASANRKRPGGSTTAAGLDRRDFQWLREAFHTLVLLVSPFAPHLAEELWQRLGHSESLAYEPWPAFDPAILEDADTLLVIQVNGKVRARLSVPAGSSEEAVKQAVLADEQVKKFVDGQSIKQVIVVPNRLVNIVT